MTRSDPNWFAAGCGLVYLLLFLFLPFYSVRYVGLTLSGYHLLSMNPVCALVLVAGVAMILSALLMDYRISIGVGCVALLMTLCFAALGGSVLSNSALISLFTSLMGESVTGSMTQVFTINMGVGSFLCMGLCIGYVVLEAVMRPRRRRRMPPQPDPFSLGSDDFHF